MLLHGYTTATNAITETGSGVLNVSSGGKVNNETLWHKEKLSDSKGGE